MRPTIAPLQTGQAIGNSDARNGVVGFLGTGGAATAGLELAGTGTLFGTGFTAPNFPLASAALACWIIRNSVSV